MDGRVRRFRKQAQVENRGRSGVRRRYSAGLRAEAVGYLVEQRKLGRSAKKVASELGVNDWSLFRWSRAETRSRLRPVEVLECPDGTPSPVVTLVTPDGYRIEGVEGRELRAILEALR